jgi:Flp pilus assembly protein TadG
LEQSTKKSAMRKLAQTIAVSLARMPVLVRDFGSNTRANTAIIFAISAIPIIAAVGCVVDYSTAMMIKTKLQAAADAASVATVSNNSPAVTTAKAMTSNGTVSGGSTYAKNMFSANLSSVPANVGYTTLTDSATVTLTGQTITAAMTFSANVPTYFMKILGYSNVAVSGTSTASVTFPTYLSFYLMLDVSGSMSFPSTAAEQARLMAVNPDNLHPSNSPPNCGYPQGCQFACHFTAQGACGQTSANGWCGSPPGPYQGTIPAPGGSTNPGSGGYCQGFIISRLGTTPASFSSTCLNDSNGSCGQYVNWTGTQVSSCATAGTTSCIQLRADAVGYAVTALLTQAETTEAQTGISNQFSVGLYPFIVNLCTASAGSSNSCSVGQTTSLTGSTINNFAKQLANLLDTGQNATLGSGGTHFENALSSMNTFITNSMIGTGGSASNPLPFVFLVTDGSQDYQTQSSGNWGSQNWSASSNVPYSNSATVMPPYNPNDQSGTINNTDWCATMKNRGITVAVLYIPYQPINDPNSAFSNNEDGYANSNIASIPSALQSCATTGFYFTASTPTDIQNALVQMFLQAYGITAHVSQ